MSPRVRGTLGALVRERDVHHGGLRQALAATALALSFAASACVPKAEPPPKPVYQPGKLVFAVLPAESPAFPIAARAATERLRRARVKGLGEPQISKVSLDVVQLQIECVEASNGCYERVGKELGANQLLFAEIANGPRPETIKVTITLFDVDGVTRRKAASKVFATEEDVVWGVADVVEEATKL
ncbi:hypothetical protein BH11MYX2_BH11MYX2_28910 [soil metagenome]